MMPTTKSITLEGKLEDIDGLHFLRAEWQRETSRFVLIRYALYGREQPLGLRLDLDKQVLLDHLDDRGIEELVRTITPDICRVVADARLDTSFKVMNSDSRFVPVFDDQVGPMRFRIQNTVLSVSLRDEPRPDASASAGTIIGTDLLEKVADATEPDWWRVRVVTPGAPERQGFVRSILLTEADQEEPSQDINKEAFFSQIAFVAQRFGGNRDYLYAVAVAESGVKNISSQSSSAVGPFQFMQDTWDGLVRDHGAETGITAADITDPGSQAAFAAILSSDAQTHLEKSLGHVPSGAQLYCAHLLGIGAATSVLAVDPNSPIDAPLRQFYGGTSRGAGFADKIIAANSGLLAGRSVEQVLDAVAARLGPGLDEAAQLAAKLGFTVDQTPPDTAPGEEPPWMIVAKQQLAMHIAEDKIPGHSNPEIDKFFTATSMGAAHEDTAWCGAFVSWCMANSGNAKVVADNRRSARAADWRSWGAPLGKPSIGAVAVLRPLVPKSSGHVGFVNGEDGGRVVLLGGNQHDQLCEAKFNKADVVQYRWLNWH